MSLSRIALGIALTAIACVAAGCSNSKASPQATRTAATAPASTPRPVTQVPEPTLSPDEIAASTVGPAVGLVPYTDPAGRYTVQLPKGWQTVRQANAVTASLPSAALTNIGIFCQPNTAKDELEAQDGRVTSSVASSHTVLGKSTTTVGGAPADLVTSITNLSTLSLHNLTAYFEGSGCAWRVQLTTASGDDYTGLATRVLQTFQFTSSSANP